MCVCELLQSMYCTTGTSKQRGWTTALREIKVSSEKGGLRSQPPLSEGKSRKLNKRMFRDAMRCDAMRNLRTFPIGKMFLLNDMHQLL